MPVWRRLPRASFGAVELLTDLLVTGGALLFALVPLPKTDDTTTVLLGAHATAFLASLGIPFGVAYYLSTPYYHGVQRLGSPDLMAALRRYGVWGASAVLAAPLCIVLGFVYSMSSWIAVLPVSCVLAAIEGAWFGLWLGVEYELERTTLSNRCLALRLRGLFDHSLADWPPPIVATAVVVFPAEHLVRTYLATSGLLVYVVAMGLAVAAGYPLARLGRRLLTGRLEIAKHMNALTVGVMSVLPAAGLLAYELWEMWTASAISVSDRSLAGRLLLLGFVGVIPLRLIHLVLVRSSLPNKLAGAIALVLYVVIRVRAA